jgi:hypothetical protein
MRSSIHRVDGGDEPFAYHFFPELDDALEAVRAADLLELPFVMHKRERQPDGEEGALEIDYVVVLLPLEQSST